MFSATPPGTPRVCPDPNRSHSVSPYSQGRYNIALHRNVQAEGYPIRLVILAAQLPGAAPPGRVSLVKPREIRPKSPARGFWAGVKSRGSGLVWSGPVCMSRDPLRLLDLHVQPACHPCSLGTPYPPSLRPGHTISSSSLLFARPVSPTVSRPRGPFWSDHPTRHSSNFCPTVGCVSPSRPCYTGLIIPT